MSANTSEIIFPCPLSKGYGIPVRQAWLLLNVFLCYRLVLACLFIFLFFSVWGSSLISIENSHLYQFSSYSYLTLTAISATCIIWRFTGYTLQAQLLILSDILILTLLMHACGGVNSGIGTLLGVSIASGGLLIGGRCAMFFAALASLSVLIEQIFAHYTGGFQPGSYSYAGMLGTSFFAIALLSYILAKRSEETLELADQQKNTIIKLEELNQYIIQHLQSGIIITNKCQHVKMANEASLRLLNLSMLPSTIWIFLSLAILSGIMALSRMTILAGRFLSNNCETTSFPVAPLAPNTKVFILSPQKFNTPNVRDEPRRSFFSPAPSAPSRC